MKLTLRQLMSLKFFKRKDTENVYVKRDNGEVTLEAQGTVITGKPRMVVELMESMQTMGESSELVEVREIANKLQAANKKYEEEILNLRKDKQALVTFIELNVTDEDKLKEIFKG